MDYDIIASDFSQKRLYVWKDLIPLLNRIKPRTRVLDLGCGNGRVLQVLTAKKVRYLGIDQSHELIKIARKHYHGYDFITGDITADLIYRNIRKVDYVLLFAVLHHILTIGQAQKLFKNICGTLNPGGLLLLSVWNMRQKRYKKLKIKNNRVTIPYKVSDGRKVVKQIDRIIRDYQPEEIAKIAHSNGFKVIDCYYSLKGKKSDQANGHNLCFILQKKV